MLRQALQEHEAAIVSRWTELVLDTYPVRTGEVLRREPDRFANPLGHAIRTAVAGLYAALLAGDQAVQPGEPLRDLVKILAVQELPASRALAFVLRFRDTLRAEIGQHVRGSEDEAALAQLERRLDEAALAAFDLYVACREELLELRRRELHRSQHWLEHKLRERYPLPESP